MAAPNINSNATINGKTTAVSLSATTETALLSNAASSNKAIRVKHVTVANSSTILACDITLRYYNAASGGTAFPIGAITVPAYGAVILIGAENPVWLEEDRRLTVQASASNQLTVLVSYEEVG